MLKMFNFFKRQKPIVLNCYTSDKRVYDYASIAPAFKYTPKWFKELPKDSQNKNMRQCFGLLDLFKRSIVIPMWCDLDIELHENGAFTWVFHDGQTNAEVHGYQQFSGWVDSSSHYHMKILSPWVFTCDDDVYFQWTQATWGLNDLFDFVSPPAVVEYKNQTSTHINLLMNAKRKKLELKFGTPLVMITPLTERKFVFKTHLVSEDEMKKIDKRMVGVKRGAYSASIKAKKCPFGG